MAMTPICMPAWRGAHVARPERGVLGWRAVLRLTIEVREIHRGANAVAEHLGNNRVPPRGVADHIRLETVRNALAPGVGGLLNQLVSALEPGGWQEHDLPALPVDGHRSNGLALHMVQQFFDDNGQLLVRHKVVSLVLEAIFTRHVALVCREQNEREMAADHRPVSFFAAVNVLRSCRKAALASLKVRNKVLTPLHP